MSDTSVISTGLHCPLFRIVRVRIKRSRSTCSWNNVKEASVVVHGRVKTGVFQLHCCGPGLTAGLWMCPGCSLQWFSQKVLTGLLACRVSVMFSKLWSGGRGRRTHSISALLLVCLLHNHPDLIKAHNSSTEISHCHTNSTWIGHTCILLRLRFPGLDPGIRRRLIEFPPARVTNRDNYYSLSPRRVTLSQQSTIQVPPEPLSKHTWSNYTARNSVIRSDLYQFAAVNEVSNPLIPLQSLPQRQEFTGPALWNAATGTFSLILKKQVKFVHIGGLSNYISKQMNTKEI